MSQIGNASVAAANRLIRNPHLAAGDAWDQSIALTTLSVSTADKVCAREAFIGLAEFGLIHGFPARPKPSTGWNGLYAIIGAHLLGVGNVSVAQRAMQAPTAEDLWRQVITPLGKGNISHNDQMTIVLALWIVGLI